MEEDGPEIESKIWTLCAKYDFFFFSGITRDEMKLNLVRVTE